MAPETGRAFQQCYHKSCLETAERLWMRDCIYPRLKVAECCAVRFGWIARVA